MALDVLDSVRIRDRRARQKPRQRRADETTRTLRETDDGHVISVHETVRDVDAPRWNDLVSRARCASVFHRHEWLAAIEDGLDFPARHLVVEKDSNVVALFPHFLVDFPTLDSLPSAPIRRLTSVYPGFGGPLVTTDERSLVPTVFDLVSDLADARTVVHEIRSCNPNVLRYTDALRRRGYRSSIRGGRFVLSLSRGYDDLLAGMSSSRRRGVRKGRENGVEVVEERLTPEVMWRFYRTYERHMASVGGEIYPYQFFERLLAFPSRLLLVTARVDGEYAGGFLELLDDETDSVHGFFAAVPEEYHGEYVSEALYDYVFRWAVEEGYDTYDFGGTGGDFEDGVFRFKAEFGGDLAPNLYWERGTSPAWPAIAAGRSLYWRHGRRFER